MNDDYKNFVERMGSFDEIVDIEADEDDEITHFGIKGMKWGHRKININAVRAGIRTGQDATNLGQTVSKTRGNKKATRSVKDISDDDLKRITARLELENRYINASTQQRGRASVESILAIAGGTLAVASSALGIYEALKKKN